MKVFKNTTAWDFLYGESWECDNLKNAIQSALCDGKKSAELEQKLNAYIDDVFLDEHVSRTSLNDFLRFYYDDILKAIGLEEYV